MLRDAWGEVEDEDMLTHSRRSDGSESEEEDEEPEQAPSHKERADPSTTGASAQQRLAPKARSAAILQVPGYSGGGRWGTGAVLSRTGAQSGTTTPTRAACGRDERGRSSLVLGATHRPQQPDNNTTAHTGDDHPDRRCAPRILPYGLFNN